MKSGLARAAIGAAFLSFGLICSMSLGDQVIIGAMQDNTLYQSNSGSISNGAGQYRFSGRTADFEFRRALVSFDVAWAVPNGSVIVGASLTLHMSRSISGAQNVALHRLMAAWGEAGSDAGGNEGGGADARPGDATWLHTFYNTDFWANAGGDFDTNASQAAIVGNVGYYTWASNVAMIADVQNWLDNPGQSWGWALIGNEGGLGTAKRFDTRENGVIDYRPMLTIDYRVVPASGSAALLPVAFGALGFSRRRRA